MLSIVIIWRDEEAEQRGARNVAVHNGNYFSMMQGTMGSRMMTSSKRSE